MVAKSLVLVLVAGFALPPADCGGLTSPVTGRPSSVFAPTGRFSGHWGVDWVVPVGTTVRAAGPGRVSFAGQVAGNLTVTITHRGHLRTSYSYLSAVFVRTGDLLASGDPIGASGIAHGRPALHFSTRIGRGYVNPLRLLGCGIGPPAGAVRLVPSWAGRSGAYAVRRAQGHPRRDLRPTSPRSPRCG